jgi:branched-chain amino acid transport system ATP-binding protein
MSAAPALLQLEAVEARYQNAVVALHGVNLEVASGEIHALLGANGAGKSTTLKAISNLLQAERGQLTAGRIVIDGCDVARRSPTALVRQGVVPVLEGRRCFASLTVEDNLLTGALGRDAKRGEMRADLARVYEMFPRLQQRRHSKAGWTSGGEQQMLAIGRALMSRPRLLLLDEPSMGLAPRVVQEIFVQLRRLNREQGMSLLVAEQNAAVALRYADRATVLETGRSVLTDRASALLARSDIRQFYLGQAVSA